MSFGLTEIQAVTNDNIDRTPVDVHFLDSVMLYRLMGKGEMELNMVEPGDTIDGGTMIRTPLLYAPANTGSYGASTVFPTSKATIMNAARFPWAGAEANNLIDVDEQTQNTGKDAIVDLAITKIDSMRTTIRDTMGTMVYGSNQGFGGYALDPYSMNGLTDLFDTTTAPYGSISVTDMPDWHANVITTSAAISFAFLQQMRRTASVGQALTKKPNLYVTTESLRDGFEATLQVQARYSDKELVQVGFHNVMFGPTAPVVADDKLQMSVSNVGSIYAMNLRFIKIRTHKAYPFTRPVWAPVSPLQPDLLTANTRWRGQMTCSNRKAHCLATAVSMPA